MHSTFKYTMKNKHLDIIEMYRSKADHLVKLLTKTNGAGLVRKIPVAQFVVRQSVGLQNTHGLYIHAEIKEW